MSAVTYQLTTVKCPPDPPDLPGQLHGSNKLPSLTNKLFQEIDKCGGSLSQVTVFHPSLPFHLYFIQDLLIKSENLIL